MPDNDDPFFSPDATRMRPRPGGGRRTYAESRQSPEPPSAGRVSSQLPPPMQAMLGAGLNPLVQSASPLLLLMAQMRETVSMDAQSLRGHALDEIKRFTDQAIAAGVSKDIVKSARYALCAGLDEAVLSTPWGSQSEWAQHPLLVQFHQEAWGGEKFFQMLDGYEPSQRSHLDLMELQYLILALGFAGKYQMAERGAERLSQYQEELYRRIREARGPISPSLSLRWRGLEDRRNPLTRQVPWWLFGAAAAAVLAITFTAYYASLAGAADPIQARLARIGLEEFSAPAPVAPPRGPTLKQLLQPEERSGTITVEESGGRTVVTLIAPDLFPAGSASVNPAYYGTLDRVTAALDKVPGRVLVVGHTDDQPIKSLRYQNNFDLSRDRAVSVVALLQKNLDNHARVTSTGVGSSQPRYRPETDAANRARNRRVEIIHVGGTS